MGETFDLGKAALDLEANLTEFRRNMAEGRGDANRMQATLDALSTVADATTEVLNRIRMKADQAAQTAGVSDAMKRSLAGIAVEAEAARVDIERVKLTGAQATESEVSGERIKHNVKDIGDEADRTKRKLAELRVAGGGHGSIGGTSVGFLGAAIGGGTLLAPAAGPATLGLLATIPVFAGAGAGALGTLALAFKGVSAAIGGDKKAFDGLQPSAQQFVQTIRSLDGWFHQLQETAGKNLFPGLTEALHSALSPGTVGAITTAITEFAQAIGAAGAAWGKYFGSREFQSLFGPLMAEGAHTFTVMSDAALHLFDALGVLARAAIPLTSWLTGAIDHGFQLAASWLHAKDASGQLAGAMNQARVSLQLVGGLIESLLKAVGALGGALYPVSKIAVKDLTDGLNALAGIIERNQTTIREIVGGALSALVSTVQTLTPIVGGLVHMLIGVANAIGGWKVAFELVIGGFLAMKFFALGGSIIGFAGSIAGAATKLGLLGLAAETSAGEIGGLRAALLGLGAPEVLAALAAVAGGIAAIAWMRSHAADIVSQSGGNITLANGQSFALGAGRVAGRYTGPGSGVDQSTIAAAGNNGGAVPHASGIAGSIAAANPANMAAGRAKLLALAKQALGTPYLWGGSGPGGFDCSGLVMWAFSNGLNISLPHSTYDQAVMGAQVNPSKAAVGNVVFTNYGENGLKGPGHEGLIVGFTKDGQPIIEAAPHTGAKVQTYTGYGAFTGGAKYTVRDLSVSSNANYSPFGSDPAFTTNTGQPTAKQLAAAAAKALSQKLQIPITNDKALVAHYKALAAAATVGPMIEKYLDDEIGALKKENVDLAKSMQGKSALQKARIRGEIQKNKDEISKLHASVVQAIKMAADQSQFAQFSAHLKSLQAKFTADSDYASVLTGNALQAYQMTLLGDLNGQASYLQSEQKKWKAKLAGATGKRLAEVQSHLAQITTDLDNVQQQVLQSLQGTVQSLQSKESSIFSRITSKFDQQFEAATQKMVDALGVRFFQNGLQTPLEQQLAKMQADDQLQSLQDAISSATDPKARAAAERQLEEYQLSIRAVAERTKADQDYANAVKLLQAQRSKLEDAMNQRLAELGDALQNGTGNISDLSSIAAEFGIQLNGDDGLMADFTSLTGTTNDLMKALQDLAAYIEKITGQSPAGASSGQTSSAIDWWRSQGGLGTTTGLGGHFPAGLPKLDLGHLRPYGAVTSPPAPGSGDVVLMVDSKELARANLHGLSKSSHIVKLTAKVIQPALGRVVSVGG